MEIAKNLKRLRLDKGLTQEEIADRIGVTGQAVSKWERGDCYPDITLLPGLANFFDVTVDELLGMSEIKGKMWGVYAKASTLQTDGKYHEAAAVFEEALKTFPGDEGLTRSRTMALAMAGEGAECAITMCERYLEDDLHFSDHSRSGVTAVLCFLYRSAGMVEKAEAIARRRPHVRDSREFLLPNFLTNAEREAYLREHLPGILTTIYELISGEIASDEEYLRRTILGAYKTIVPTDVVAEKIVEFMSGR